MNDAISGVREASVSEECVTGLVLPENTVCLEKNLLSLHESVNQNPERNAQVLQRIRSAAYRAVLKSVRLHYKHSDCPAWTTWLILSPYIETFLERYRGQLAPQDPGKTCSCTCALLPPHFVERWLENYYDFKAPEALVDETVSYLFSKTHDLTTAVAVTEYMASARLAIDALKLSEERIAELRIGHAIRWLFFTAPLDGRLRDIRSVGYADGDLVFFDAWPGADLAHCQKYREALRFIGRTVGDPALGHWCDTFLSRTENKELACAVEELRAESSVAEAPKDTDART